MALAFGTASWARALQDHINGSSEYRNAAAKWGAGFNGNVLLHFEPDAHRPEPAHLLLRLAGGQCQGAEFLQAAEHPDAGFTLQAPFSAWKDILDGKALAATAILAGRLRVRGDKMALLKYAAAKRALLHCVGQIETAW